MLPRSSEEKLRLWFEDLLSLVNENYIARESKKFSEAIGCIDRAVVQDFQTKLSDCDWWIQIKTDIWKKSVLETAIRLVKLESRFQAS